MVKLIIKSGMVKIIGKVWPGRIVLGPREIWVISPTGCMFASKDYAAAMSRPRSGVPVALAEYGK